MATHRSFSLGLFTLVGTTMGAGIFALPGLFARFGLWQATLCYFILAAFVVAVQRLYVDVILAVPTIHRLPGYARLTLGKRWGMVGTLTYFVTMYGAHVVYLLVGGTFLQAILAQFRLSVPVRFASVCLFAMVALAVWGGLRRVAHLEKNMARVNIGLFLVLALTALFRGGAPTQFVPHPSWEAFGLVLFALSALSIIPEVTELCERNKKRSQQTVLYGTILAAVVVWFFAFAFAYAGGTQLTAQPNSLAQVLPRWASWLLPIVGFFAIATAYTSTAESLQASWKHDYRLTHAASWALAMFPSLVLALCLNDGFILIATILGTICSGANGVLIGMMRIAVAEERHQALAIGLGLLIVFTYAFGMSGQITSWLFL